VGEPINGCDTQENPCAEMDVAGDLRDGPVTVAAVRSELALDRPVMLIALDDGYAEQARAAFADRGVPTAICDSLAAAAETARTGVVAIVTTETLGRDSAADVRSTMHGLHLLGMVRDPIANPDFEEGTRGWLSVFDDAGDLTQAHLDAARASWMGRPFGPGKSASARMSDDTMDSIFGDDAIARERRRRSIIICDERPMRDMAVLAMKASLPAKGFDYGAINQRHTIRNGTRVKPTRGRYK